MFNVPIVGPIILKSVSGLFLLVNVCTFALANQDNIAASHAAESIDHIVVTVLGSGTPDPSPTQFGAAILVQAGGKNMMFDCGRGCTTRLAQLDKKLINKVDHLFVTHLHSDHLMGIDDLWLNGWTQGRKVPLQTWGPEGTNDMMDGLRSAFKRDISYRRNDKVPAPSAALDNAFTDLPFKGGVALDKDGVKVTAFLVDHATIVPAYGYKIEYKGHSVVISGDTTTTASLYQQGKDVDVLMLEVMSPSTVDYLKSIFSPKQIKTVLGYHMTADQTADILKETNPSLGVFYHTNNSEEATKSLLKTTHSIYKGDVAVSYDLFQIVIGDDIKTFNAIDKRKAGAN